MHKFLEILKRSKVKIAIVSGFLATMLLSALVSSSINSSQVNKNPIENVNLKPVGYEDLEEIGISINEDGSIVYPTIIDEENPDGNYEYKLPEVETYDSAAEIKSNPEVEKEVDKQIAENKALMLKSFNFDMSVNIEITDALQILIANIVPNAVVEPNTEMSLSGIFEKLFEASTVNAKEKILSNTEISDLLSLVNINYKKEVNDLAIKSEAENPNSTSTIRNSRISLYGGGGSVEKPTLPPPVVDTDFGEDNTGSDN